MPDDLPMLLNELLVDAFESRRQAHFAVDPDEQAALMKRADLHLRMAAAIRADLFGEGNEPAAQQPLGST